LPDGQIFGQITQKGPKNCPWPGPEIGGHKMVKFCKKLQKRGRKIFLQLFCRETIQLFVISYIFSDVYCCKRGFKKLFYTAFARWQNFFQIFLLSFSRKGSEKSGKV
jgi:hypothetical protein